MTIPAELSFSSPDFVRQLQMRGEEAITAVVKAYTSHLFRAALGLGFNASGANELVQAVWNTFFEVLPNFKGGSHIRTFLFGILYNKAKEQRRDNARYQLKDEAIDESFDAHFDEGGRWRQPPMDPEKFLLSAETMGRIEECIEELPHNQKMAFVLKEVEDQESTEICKVLEVTTTNLGVLLFRARNRLRDCLEAKGE